MSIEFAIVQDALEVSIVLLISFEHLEVTPLIFRIISGVCVSLLLPVIFPILRSNLLFSFLTGIISLLSDLRNCWIGKASGRHLPFTSYLHFSRHPFYNPIMLRYSIVVLVPPVPVPSLFLFLAALVESLFFCWLIVLV